MQQDIIKAVKYDLREKWVDGLCLQKKIERALLSLVLTCHLNNLVWFLLHGMVFDALHLFLDNLLVKATKIKHDDVE